MIHPLVRNIALTALTVSAMALGACSDSSTELPGYGDITMRLTVDPGTAPAASRATAPDRFENPDPDDAFEQVSTLRVIILRGVPQGEDAVGTVEANKLVHTNSEGYPYENLEFKVKDNEYKRVYLIANESSLPVPGNVTGVATSREYLDQFKVGEQLNTQVFTDWQIAAPADNVEFTGNIFSNVPGQVGLPLTEWFDVPVLLDSKGRSDAPGAKDNVSISVHLFLTRAAAKATFDVKVDDEYPVSGTNITAIRLNRLNRMEYAFPRNATYSPVKYPLQPEMDQSGVTERYITDFDSPSSSYPSYTISGLSIPVVAGSEATVPTIYFPESKRPDDLPYTVEVLLDGDKGNTTWLTAQPLGSGSNNILVTPDSRQAIARNTHLRITIGFTKNGNITWQAIVAPYNTVELKPGFGL